MNDELNPFQRRAKNDFDTIRRHPAFHDAVNGSSSGAAREAALYFAQSLGYCRLWGVDLGDRDGSLPARLLPDVCSLLTLRVDEARLSLEQYERDMELVRTAEEAELSSASALRLRMDAWAVWIAIDERLSMLLDDRSPIVDEQAVPFGPLLTQLMDTLQQWDADLEARADLLVAIQGTYLIENWRSALADPYRRTPPWWLDDDFWASVDLQSVPNYLPVPPQQEKVTAVDRNARRAFASAPAAVTNVPVREPLTVAAAAGDAPHREYRFFSRADRTGALAIVQVPRHLDGRGRLAVDIRFLYAAREPDLVCAGNLVSLGDSAAAPIVADFPGDDAPVYAARIVLNRSQVERLRIEQFLRLRVGRQFWQPESTR